MAVKKFSSEEAVRFGWGALKTHVPIFLWLLLFHIILSVLRGILIPGQNRPHSGMMWASQSNSSLAFLFSIVFFVLNSLLTIGTMQVLLLLVKGKNPTVNDIFSRLDVVWQYIIASICSGLILVAGFILLIVPGIIWAIKFQFYPFIILEKKVGPIEALKRSAAITKGNMWNLFLFGLLLIGLNILGLLCLVIGLLVTIPVSMIASAYVYKKLSA